ncbi:hypothetical protein LEP1GSC072_0247 [Leptospira noguchii str. Bonito]|nr:hypothetical protein LEP1GSC072_0247 [Leptospira noguchii str. Bonito]
MNRGDQSFLDFYRRFPKLLIDCYIRFTTEEDTRLEYDKRIFTSSIGFKEDLTLKKIDPSNKLSIKNIT